MIDVSITTMTDEHVYEFVIEGMRNPKNSWERSDSEVKDCNWDCADRDCPRYNDCCEAFVLGDNDKSLMMRLCKAGTEHRKFMRMMPVYLHIKAPLYWWKEFDTYKIGTVTNSCSTMHKIAEKEFTVEDFSCEHLNNDSREILSKTIEALNKNRELYLKTSDQDYWWQMIQLLPSSYNQTRNVMLNYEVLANIYRQRRYHKLDEWRTFCNYIITNLPYPYLITGDFA